MPLGERLALFSLGAGVSLGRDLPLGKWDSSGNSSPAGLPFPSILTGGAAACEAPACWFPNSPRIAGCSRGSAAPDLRVLVHLQDFGNQALRICTPDIPGSQSCRHAAPKALFGFHNRFRSHCSLDLLQFLENATPLVSRLLELLAGGLERLFDRRHLGPLLLEELLSLGVPVCRLLQPGR